MPRKAKRVDAHARAYGDRREDEQLRAALPQPETGPLPRGPGTPPQPGPANTPPALGPAARMEAALAAAQGHDPGVGGGLLTGPSKRPNEPWTTGLSTGPGAGPEALGPAVDPIDPDLVALAPFLPTLELMSNGPTATVQSRNLVRRLRAIVPRQAIR